MTVRTRLRGALLHVAMTLGALRVAHADMGTNTDVKTVGQGARSPLEESLVAEALLYHGFEEDPHPEGKTIEAIDVYVAKVFDRRDPIPAFVNIFHARTRNWVIHQEVLLQPGQPWELGRVLETERNLRNLRQLSLANVVAVQGSAYDKVRLLVVTKDVWSLRLNSSWEVNSSGLDYLLLNPTEENLAGTRMTLGLLFMLERDRYFIGGNYLYPRLGGTRYDVGARGGVYQNRWSGEYEGNYGTFYFELPQYSRHSAFAYGAQLEWSISTARQYRGALIDVFAYDDEAGSIELIPLVYESDYLQGSYWWLRSWGVEHKADLSFGLQLSHQRFRMPAYDEFSPQAIAAFVSQELPTSDTQLGPSVGLSVYETRFLRALNVESLSLQEDIRLGYAVSTLVFAGARSLGSTRDFVGARGRVGYTARIADGFVRVGATNRIVVANQRKNEGLVTARARFVSPQLGAFRLHVDAYLAHQYRNYLNDRGHQLGGDNRLRGYLPGDLRGTNVVSGNVEWRTRGVDILSAQVGLAAFYDIGAAHDVLRKLKFYQGTGLGIRILFPQADRNVLRFDWGVPVSGDRNVFPGSFVFTFGQAFSVPEPNGSGSPFTE